MVYFISVAFWHVFSCSPRALLMATAAVVRCWFTSDTDEVCRPFFVSLARDFSVYCTYQRTSFFLLWFSLLFSYFQLCSVLLLFFSPLYLALGLSCSSFSNLLRKKLILSIRDHSFFYCKHFSTKISLSTLLSCISQQYGEFSRSLQIYVFLNFPLRLPVCFLKVC